MPSRSPEAASEARAQRSITLLRERLPGGLLGPRENNDRDGGYVPFARRSKA